MRAATLDLDLEVFQGPFDLLLTLVLREEVDLLEVDLADVVLAYVEHLERAGELDLEATTEFLVLIAALLELKSRLMLPREGEEEGLPELERGEAVEELLARLLEYRRYRAAAAVLGERLAEESGFRYRAAPLPPELRRVSVEVAARAYEAEGLARAIGDLLRAPPALDLGHLGRPTVSIDERLRHLRALLSTRGRFSFDEAVAGADRTCEAVTLFALLELYKAGEASWEQKAPFGPITVKARPR
jgi:segregation and condensation protein A